MSRTNSDSDNIPPRGESSYHLIKSSDAMSQSSFEVTSENINIKQVESVFNDNVSTPNYHISYLSDLKLGLKVLEILKSKGWDGKSDMPKFSWQELGTELLDRVAREELARKNAFDIPQEYHKYYLGNEQDNIKKVILVARDEYIRYLQAKGVDQKYISRINEIFPPQNDRILTDTIMDASGPISLVQNDVQNINLLQMVISSTNINNDARLIRESLVLTGSKFDDYGFIRDMAIRRQVYHEMTHVLQRAYDSLNKDKDKVLAEILQERFTNWGDKSLLVGVAWQNKDIAQEAQAERVSYEILTYMYNLSDRQKDSFWKTFFERFSDGRNDLKLFLSSINSSYPVYSPDDFGEDVVKSIDITGVPNTYGFLPKIFFRLIGIPAYGGYLNPMTEIESISFWEILK